MNKEGIIRHILVDTRYTQSAVARMMGINRSTLAMRITSDNISLENFSEILKALDYKIVVMPASVKTPKGGYEVE